MVGHLAQLQPFNEHGEKINLGAGSRTQPTPPNPKGQRTAYRPARTFPNMSEEAMHQAAEKSTIAFRWDPDAPKAAAGIMSGNAPPLSNFLVGKEFNLVGDVKIVENTEKIAIGRGLWGTTSDGPKKFKMYAADPIAGQVGFIGIMQHPIFSEDKNALCMHYQCKLYYVLDKGQV